MSSKEPPTTSDSNGSLPCSRRDIGRATIAAGTTLFAAQPVTAAGGPYSIKMEADIPSSAGISLTIHAGTEDGVSKDSVSISESTIQSGLSGGVFEQQLSTLSYSVGDVLWVSGTFNVDTTNGLYPTIHSLEFTNDIKVNSALLEVDAVIPEDTSATIRLFSSDRKLDEPFNSVSLSNGVNAYEIRDEWISEDAEIWVEGKFEFGRGATEEQKNKVGIKDIRIVEIGEDPTGELNVTVSEEAVANSKLDLGPKLPTIGSDEGLISGLGKRGLNFTMTTAKYLAFIGLIGGAGVWILDTNENRSETAFSMFKYALGIVLLYIGFEAVVSVMRFIGEGATSAGV